MNPEAEASAPPPSEPRPEGVRVLTASEFRAKCLKLMDEVAAGAGDIVITKNGRPVARLTRLTEPQQDEPARAQIRDDIVPTEDEREAETDPDRTPNP